MGRMIQRRWFQFTLRTALVLVTTLCVWLGWWANSAHRQRLAVEQIKAASNWVTYDRRPENVRVPKGVRSFLGDDFFVNVTEIHVNAMMPDDLAQVVAAMQGLPKATNLSI